MKKKLIIIATKYFKLFENKNIDELSKLFSHSVILKDWEIKIKGRKKLINFLTKVFDANSFKIKIINHFTNEIKKINACKIIITLKGKKKLQVIDIIHFDKNLKIKKIEAYKC